MGVSKPFSIDNKVPTSSHSQPLVIIPIVHCILLQTESSVQSITSIFNFQTPLFYGVRGGYEFSQNANRTIIISDGCSDYLWTWDADVCVSVSGAPTGGYSLRWDVGGLLWWGLHIINCTFGSIFLAMSKKKFRMFRTEVDQLLIDVPVTPWSIDDEFPATSYGLPPVYKSSFDISRTSTKKV